MAGSYCKRSARRALAGTLLAGLAFTVNSPGAAVPEGGAAPTPQKYRFPQIAAVGDSQSIDDVLDMQFDMVVTLQGQEIPSKFSMRARETYVEDVLAVAKGIPTVLRRKYTAHREAETGPDGQTKLKVSTLQGKTVTIRLNGKKVSVVADKGKLAPEDVKKLQEKFTNDDSPDFIPDRDMAPGDEWTVPSEAVAKAFGGLDKGEIKGRFEQIRNEGGRSLAEFRLDLDLQGSGGGSPVPLTMKGTGFAFYDLKLKRELGARVSGPLSLEGDLEQNGQTLRIVGSGLLDAHQSVRWLKVAGKPVNAPAYPLPGAPVPPAPNRQTRL